MTRNYKTNWQGKRTSTRFPVTFDAPKIASEVKEACTICGGKIEECPMMRGVCYSCYRDIIGKEEHKALKIVLDVTRPTYDELIHGAKFTDEHRAELHKEWNEKYSDAEVQKRLNVTP